MAPSIHKTGLAFGKQRMGAMASDAPAFFDAPAVRVQPSIWVYSRARVGSKRKQIARENKREGKRVKHDH